MPNLPAGTVVDVGGAASTSLARASACTAVVRSWCSIRDASLVFDLWFYLTLVAVEIAAEKLEHVGDHVGSGPYPEG